MGKRDPALTLLQIQEFAETVVHLCEKHQSSDLVPLSEFRLALEHAILLLGEACGRLDREFQQQHTQIPWSEIIGMRNFLVHGYDMIDPIVLWDTATMDIPKLVLEIKNIRKNRGEL